MNYTATHATATTPGTARQQHPGAGAAATDYCRTGALTGERRGEPTGEALADVVELHPGTSAMARHGAAMRMGHFLRAFTGSQRGMATAEYAIATLAAVGFAGLLVVILRSEEVRGFLLNLVRTALSLP